MVGVGRCRQLVARTALCAAAIIGVTLVGPVAPSSAQGLFDFFWGNRGGDRGDERWNERGFDRWNERGRDSWQDRSEERRSFRSDEQTNERRSAAPAVEPSRKPARAPAPPREDKEQVPVAASNASVAYCVRLCDGRYFPIQRSGGEPAEICNAFCPAAKTKIYSGSAIDSAVANDGKRYSSLPTAYTYRQQVVPDCSCNGRDSFGLARLDASKDPTLRAGDIVARDGALMAFKGSKKNTHTAGDFTPIQTYAQGESNLRKNLSGVKVAPPVTTNLSNAQAPENTSVIPAGSQPVEPDKGKRGSQASR